MATRRDTFTTIRTEGALLPADFLQRVAAGDKNVPGLTPAAYHLGEHEKLSEAITRSWNRLLGFWAAFQSASAGVKDAEPGTGLTRDKWLLPLFQELGYGRLPPGKGFAIEGKAYPISHAWQNTPIHLLGRNVDLDRSTKGVAGAARGSPHGLMQEFLNRSEGHLWGFLSNGLRLRMLRDNKSLTRQAYVEFDVGGMMDGQIYSDFGLLWLLCHQSRLEAERAEQCWLEKWADAAQQQGTRALDQLRDGVQQAIEALGRGFLAHSANRDLLAQLRDGKLDKQDYYRQLLRTVYRLIFLFVAEDRDLLLTATAGSRERERYLNHYSVQRLRSLAERRRGSPHPDLWRTLKLIFAKLSSDTGCPQLSLPALGSFLWSGKATPDVDGCELANADLLHAVRSLAFTLEGKLRRGIDYRNLGAEELGSVYESLLELHPDINADAPTFDLKGAAGNERKKTGSYYTPTSLIECLLDSALEPVLQEAAKQPDPEKAILDLRVCDPACGSGHFLIAAAHRMANRLAAFRTGDEEASPEAVRKALRDIVGRCLYGVDINPMAVELCKVNLWLEALDPGKPLSFLEHHIQCGNSLLGATHALLAKGIPDEAFEPLEGDDKAICRIFRRKNKAERDSGQTSLLEAMHESSDRLAELAIAVAELDAIAGDTPEGQRAKQERWDQVVRSKSYESGRLRADGWCAAFVWKKVDDPKLPYPITEEIFHRIEKNPLSVPDWMQVEIHRIAGDYRFFHWHLGFPDVLRAQGGGFDVVLGNPPWERVKLQKEEWFASHGGAHIANAPNAAARDRLIRALKDEEPVLYAGYQAALRIADAESAFLRSSGAYPLAGAGDVNTFAVFTELGTRLVAERGILGLIVPTGLATDEQLKAFFESLVEDERLVSLTGFENEEFLFPGIANVVRYCAIAISGRLRRTVAPRLAFYIRNAQQVSEAGRYFSLSRDELRQLNPNTLTCPVFRTRLDAELNLRLYGRFPILRGSGTAGNPWGLAYVRMFDMANDSGLFLSQANQQALPLYEAKLFWHYDHRFGSYEFKGVLKGKGGRGLPDMPLEAHQDPRYAVVPRYWVDRRHVEERLEGVWGKRWLLAYRTTASAKLERTLVGAVLPYAAVNHKAPLMLIGTAYLSKTHLFLGCFNSIVMDYLARQKVGGTDVGYYHIDQLPFPPPSEFKDESDAFVRSRVLELTFTAEDVRPFAQELGWNRGPFKWDPERRFAIQCELDAFCAHLYGLSRDEWLFILDPHQLHGPSYPGESFRVLKEKEIQRYGEFRTGRVCLEAYDGMARAKQSGANYPSLVEPPPGSPVAAW